MSKVIKKLKKAIELKKKVVEAEESVDFRNLEVSDIRKKIFEKIRQRQSSAGKNKPVILPGISEKIEAVISPEKPAEPAVLPVEEPSTEETATKTGRKKSAKEAQLKEEIGRLTDKVNLLQAENERLAKSYGDTQEAHNEALKARGETAKELESLRSQLEEKGGIITRLQSRPAEDINEIKKDRDKAAANIEALRSKLYAATKEAKEKEGRIVQLEETLKLREKKLAANDMQVKKAEAEKEDIAARLSVAEDRTEGLEEKVSGLEKELDLRDKKAAEAEKLNAKNIEAAKKELSLQIQSIEREKRSLEGKISQLNAEIEAKNRRIVEYENSHNELDDMIKDSAMKVDEAESRVKDIQDKLNHINSEMEASDRRREADKAESEKVISGLRADIELLKNTVSEKEKLETEFKENVSRLESEIEARDKKIQTDIKYCEGIVKEVNDLRQKMKALRLKFR